MEPGTPSASLHSMNSQNRHELHRTQSNTNLRQLVRDYNRDNAASKSGIFSRFADSAIGYELIGSVAAIAVLGTVVTVAIR